MQEKIDAIPLDATYQERTIKFDAQRAAKLGESPEKSCSWPEESWQREYWLDQYFLAKSNCSEISKAKVIRDRYRASGKFMEAKAVENVIRTIWG